MMSADPTLSNLSVPRLGVLESTPTPRGIGSSDSSLEGLVRQAKQGNASDVHLCVGEAPRMRIRGVVDELDQLIAQCTYDGMQTMNQALYDLVQAGRVDPETAIESSPRSNELTQMLRGKVSNRTALGM